MTVPPEADAGPPRFEAALPGIMLAAGLGLAAYGVKVVGKSPMLDPLVVGLVLGIVVRTIMGDRPHLRPGLLLAPTIFIPIGVACYALKNMNFVKVTAQGASWTVLLVAVALVYCLVIGLLGRKLGQKRAITFLVAAGSAICGASAIAITVPAVDADSDETSVSLLGVLVAGLIGLFLVLPFLGAALEMSGETYAHLSGAVIQFTGFVKVAMSTMPALDSGLDAKALSSLAVSVKAARFLGLLIIIPLFASLVRGKVYFPWVLWVFLGFGILGTWAASTQPEFTKKTLLPAISPIYGIAWSIAMASIGGNADVKKLLSVQGIYAMIMALAGFAAALLTFMLGVAVLRLA